MVLPTLGIQKYTNNDLNVNIKNPFSSNPTTEQLFIYRERQREF